MDSVCSKTVKMREHLKWKEEVEKLQEVFTDLCRSGDMRTSLKNRNRHRN